MQEKHQDEREPVGQINYLNVVSQSIQKINEACLMGTNPREAAENLITDLPEEWAVKVKNKFDIAESEYNKILESQKKYLVHGVKLEVKQRASNCIMSAEIKYSRKIKRAVVSLFHDMGMLVQTRAQVPHGEFLDLYKEFGITPEKDDD